MTWSGTFVFGDDWAAYRGPTADNTAHSHAALQLVFAREGETVVELENDRHLTGKALLIRPTVIHQIVGSREVGLIYIEPQAPLAFSLMDLIGPEDAEPLPWTVAQQLDPAAEPCSWIPALRGALPNPTRKLDPRIKEAMKWLAANPVPNAIALAAKSCSLSDSHLRALTRTQLGFPLSTWLVWRKLERAVHAIAEGLSLAEAATAAGFSDQAHCARTMRRMFGVTPSVARATLRCAGTQTARCGGTTHKPL